jgi:hypothetical protein
MYAEARLLMAAKTEVPHWFVQFTTFTIVLMIPWVVWISKQSVEMGVKQTYILDRLEKIEEAQDK